MLLHGPYQNEGARRKLATTVLFAGDVHKTLPPSNPAFVSWPMAVIKKTPGAYRADSPCERRRQPLVFIDVRAGA